MQQTYNYNLMLEISKGYLMVFSTQTQHQCKQQKTIDIASQSTT